MINMINITEDLLKVHYHEGPYHVIFVTNSNISYGHIFIFSTSISSILYMIIVSNIWSGPYHVVIISVIPKYRYGMTTINMLISDIYQVVIFISIS